MSRFHCDICGQEIKQHPMGNSQHAKKHKREFAEETGWTHRMNYEIVKAYYNPDAAATWAEEIIKALRVVGKIPKNNGTLDQEYPRKSVTKQVTFGPALLKKMAQLRMELFDPGPVVDHMEVVEKAVELAHRQVVENPSEHGDRGG